jgi:hypothetical protein
LFTIFNFFLILIHFPIAGLKRTYSPCSMIEISTLPQKKVAKITERIFGLDLMRAVSIVAVFLSHSMPLNPLDNYFPVRLAGARRGGFFCAEWLSDRTYHIADSAATGDQLESCKGFLG